MGWWPSKLIVVLNLIILLGYSMIGLVVAGQILSAVSSNNSMSVVVGRFSAMCYTGPSDCHSRYHYRSYYSLLCDDIRLSNLSHLSAVRHISLYLKQQLLNVDTAMPSYLRSSRSVSCTEFQAQSLISIHHRVGTPGQLLAIGIVPLHIEASRGCSGSHSDPIFTRISFFSLCLSAAISYGGGAADFFVYYPPSTSRPAIFAASLLGLAFSFTFALIAGIGPASAIPTRPSFSDAYDISQGALLVTALDEPLGRFGRFLGVVIALTNVANSVAPTYVVGIDIQILGRGFARVPRVIWNTVGVIIYTVCALAGRDHLSEIFTNFLALMGYWVAIWIAITVEEQLVFRRQSGYDWTAWNTKEKLPLGVAALAAFLVGWAGAILCMAQVWYIGPIAKTVGDYGADVS